MPNILCYVFASERSERGNLQRLLRPFDKLRILAMTSNIQSCRSNGEHSRTLTLSLSLVKEREIYGA
jgi:hypothetical protein